MNRSTQWIVALLSALITVITITLYFTIAPTSIGGRSTYVILHGNSMQPSYSEDDLVLVRESNSYQVGDIVLYEHPDLGSVFHRIIGQDGMHYFMKGDNNNWVDSYFPSDEDILGILWLHLPWAGTILQKFKEPPVFTILVLSICIFTGYSLAPQRTSSENANRFLRLNFLFRKDRVIMKNRFYDVLFLALVLFLGSGLLGYQAFKHPIEDYSSRNIAYTQEGQFEYFALAPDGVYQEGFLQSGDPVFRRLTESLNVLFHYDLNASELEQASITVSLSAVISDANGWNHTMQISAPEQLGSSQATISGTLDIKEYQRVVSNLEKQTGIQNNSYTLTLKPYIEAEGLITGQSFVDSFSPELTFQIDELRAKLLIDETEEYDPFFPVKEGFIQNTTLNANTIPILGFELNVLVARIISVYGMIFSLMLILRQTILYNRLKNLDEITRIQMQYGSTFIDVKEGFFETRNIIDVMDMHELASLAAQDRSIIYHYSEQEDHHYFVIPPNNGNIVYHCSRPNNSIETALLED